MTSVSETIAIPNHVPEKYTTHLHQPPLNNKTSRNDSTENVSDNESHCFEIYDIKKSILDQEEITKFEQLQLVSEDFESSSNSDSDNSDDLSSGEEQDDSKFYKHEQTIVCNYKENLPVIEELEEELWEEITEEKETQEKETGEKGTPEEETQEEGTPEKDNPKEETPKAETPKNETAEETTPEEKALKEETPKNETSEEQTPKKETLGGEVTPEEETPKNETPEEETPAEEVPKEEQAKRNEEEDNQQEVEANEQKNKKEKEICTINSDCTTIQALKEYITNNSSCDGFNENSTKVEVHRSVTKNGECVVGEIHIDRKVVMEFIPYASAEEKNQAKPTVHQTEENIKPETLEQQAEDNLICSSVGPDSTATNLDGAADSGRKPVKNFHPLFKSADGESHELLLKHRRVMKLTKPSPYERFQKCTDLRRYFGGLPSDYECSKHKEENRVPLWMQKYLYDYRLFLRTFQSDFDEEEPLKRLVKPYADAEKEKLLKELASKTRPAKICRLCGEKCERFVSTGENVVIKLVSVYLPLVIIEGNRFPLGLCDKCDYSLALICSFMLTYLDCRKLEKNEKKCFTCGCAIENLLTVANRKTMRNLAAAFHGIRFDLGEFLGEGLKYLCNACRVSFELLESLREHIWVTNKMIEDGDKRLYEKEEAVCKNYYTCELPPGFFCPPKKDATLRDSIDNFSEIPMTNTETYYKDDFEPRKYFLKRRQRHMIRNFFRRFRSSQSTESSQQLRISRKGQERAQQCTTLKRGARFRLQQLRKLFCSESTESLAKPPENQTNQSNEILQDLSKESMENDNPISPSACCSSISKMDSPEQSEKSEQRMSDETELSLVNFYLSNMDTSLFAYFNADVVLPSDSAQIQADTQEPQPSTSKGNGA